MELAQTWGGIFTQSLQGIWYGIAGFVPGLIIAVIIFAIGWILASLVEKLVEGIFKSFKVDGALKTAGLEDVVERSGHKLNSGKFVGSLVKWFVMLVFLIGAFEILKLNQVTAFLRDILDYLPQVIVAVIILIAAGMVADVMKRVVQSSAMTAGVSSSGFLATVTKWVIWVFAILVALSQLGIASAFIQTIFTGLIVALSLGLGLAFGLGGQEAASKLIEKVGKEISDKR